jgi:hypothetical protein
MLSEFLSLGNEFPPFGGGLGWDPENGLGSLVTDANGCYVDELAGNLRLPLRAERLLI